MNRYHKRNIALAAVAAALLLITVASWQRETPIQVQTEDKKELKKISEEAIKHVEEAIQEQKGVPNDKLTKLDEVRELIKSADNHVAMDDPNLLEIIRLDHMKWPPKEPYSEYVQRSASKDEFSQMDQDKFIDEYFGGKSGGFFIEAGAFNGVYLSNTLYLEMKRNWTGLLVEANGKAFQGIMDAKRKSYAFEGCLALTEYPEKVVFDGADVFGGIKDADVENNLERARNGIPEKLRSDYDVQCFPIYSLLLALGNPKVDYFSLDVEGAEMDILKTIPWDKVDIETFSIEFAHLNKVELKKYMLSQGYTLLKQLDVDYIFAKN